MKKLILAILLLIIFLFPSKILACQYGETEVSKSITIDKKVKNPNTNDWVDNLFASDYKFRPEDKIEFKITVKNTGNSDLENLKFKDILPNYLNYVSGDTEVVFNLKTNESRDFYLTAKAVKSNDLENGLSCVVNTSEAWMGNELNKDTAQVCIEKKVLAGFKALPKAGPAENSLFLAISVFLGLTGLALVKKSY